MSAELFELTNEEYAAILDASRPVPYIIVGGVGPVSPQERANAAWQRLGLVRGFDWRTVKGGPDDHHFWAQVVDGSEK